MVDDVLYIVGEIIHIVGNIIYLVGDICNGSGMHLCVCVCEWVSD